MSFTASSHTGAGNEPWEGRLNGKKAWCAGDNDTHQYLQIDFGRIRTVSSITTQGHPFLSHWVTQYGLSYSSDGIFWRKALGEDQSVVIVNAIIMLLLYIVTYTLTEFLYIKLS